MPKPRYDKDEDVSRHAAASAEDCLEMERTFNWKLDRIEELPEAPNQVFEVDCVFEGETDFPKSYYDTDKEDNNA